MKSIEYVLAAMLLLGFTRPGDARADVYNCSHGYSIVYQETPCDGGVNLSADPEIQRMVRASKPRIFFTLADPAPPYQPVRAGEVGEEEILRFFSKLADACESHDFNRFFSLFEYINRASLRDVSDEELADWKRKYCTNEMSPDRIRTLMNSGDFSIVEDRSTNRGVRKGSVCWKKQGQSQCDLKVDMAVEDGELVRDEY